MKNVGSNDGDLQMLEARRAVIKVNFLSRKPRLPRAIGHRATFATFWTSSTHRHARATLFPPFLRAPLKKTVGKIDTLLVAATHE